VDARRYRRLHDLVERASAVPADEREAFLADACDDPTLRDEARRLLADTVATRDLFAAAPDAPAADPADPVPPLQGALGRYELRRELGRGGMGAVYEALDPPSGKTVALKVLHPFLLVAPRHVERFRREAAAGRRVAHENVVRTLGADEAEKDGLRRHFLVMEYVEGRTLEELQASLGVVPEGLLREIARQTAAGLAAIHAKGIVHRDLKPGNILISREGGAGGDERVRIMDLGVARLEDASVALTREGQFVGSLEYASPEQGAGRPPTPGSDLYALGVVLYELATGTNPFRKETALATLSAHQSDTPPPPHELRPELSPFFSRVVLTLLAKDPEERFGSAEELGEVLSGGETTAWWTARARRGRRVRPQLPVRRDTLLVGRDAELGVLADHWRAARGGDGRAVLVEGEAGLGKSRLVDAFLQGVVDDVHVLYGSFPPSGGRRGLLDAVRGFVDGREPARVLRAYLAPSPTLIESFAALATGVPPPPDAPAPGPDAVQTAFVHLARGLARERPTIWIVEDLHFADDETRLIVQALARAVPDHALLLLATSRPPVPPAERPAFHARIPLARLSPREVTQLLESRLGDPARAAELAAPLARQSDGIPFFLLELLRTAGGDGGRGLAADGDEARVPEAVRSVVAARLDALDADERALLDAGAVLGFQFDADVVATVLERPLVRVLQRLAAIERRHGLVRPAGRRYRFDHHLVQEVLYADLPEMLRAELHALVAARLAAGAEGTPEGHDALRVVRHGLAGTRPAEVAAFVEPALDYLASQYRHDDTAALARRALAVDGLLDDRACFAVLTRLLGACDMAGRREDQRAATEEAFEVARRCGDPLLIARARGNLGHYFWNVGRPAEAIGHYDAAIRTMDEHDVDDRELFWKLRINRAVSLSHANRHEESLAALAEVRDGAHDHAGMRALAASNHGAILTQVGRFDEARTSLGSAIELARAAGKKRAEAICEGALGLALWNLGRFDETRPHYERQGALSREIGDRRGEATSGLHLGMLARTLGRLAEAVEHFRAAGDLSDQIGEPRNASVARLSLGGLELLCGRPEAARPLFEEALDLGTRFHPAIVGHVHLARAEMAVLEGDADAARAALDAARGPLAELRDRGGLITVARLAADVAPSPADAVRHAEEMVRLAREHDRAPVLYTALARRAAAPDGDAFEALALLPDTEPLVPFTDRMRARYDLWRATDDRAHLQAARALLRRLVDGAPADAREGLARRVPLYRRITTGS